MRGRILLVEDEEVIGSLVQSNLESHEYELEWAQSLKEARDFLRGAYFDLIILDLMLPDGSGFDLAKEIRGEQNLVPILMLTARGEVENRVAGLHHGADDYLVKPFHLEELFARVEALLRRGRSEKHLPSDSILRFGEYEINLQTREARGNNGRIVLGEKETRIMGLLASREGDVVSRADILEEAWGMDVSPTERTVDNFMVKLRKEFEADPRNPVHILNVRGVGYRFVS